MILFEIIGIAILSLVILVAVLINQDTHIKGDEESLASEISETKKSNESKMENSSTYNPYCAKD